MRALRSTWGARLLAVCLAAGLLVPLLAPVAVQKAECPRSAPDASMQAQPIRMPLAQWAGRLSVTLQRLTTAPASFSDLSRTIGEALPVLATVGAKRQSVTAGVRSEEGLPVLDLATLFSAQPLGP